MTRIELFFILIKNLWCRLQGDIRVYFWYMGVDWVSVAKTISYRILSTLSISTIAFVFTGSLSAGIAIGGTELVVNSVIYYLHEKGWRKILRRSRNVN